MMRKSLDKFGSSFQPTAQVEKKSGSYHLLGEEKQ
jgi:hypothetical protein